MGSGLPSWQYTFLLMETRVFCISGTCLIWNQIYRWNELRAKVTYTQNKNMFLPTNHLGVLQLLNSSVSVSEPWPWRRCRNRAYDYDSVSSVSELWLWLPSVSEGWLWPSLVIKRWLWVYFLIFLFCLGASAQEGIWLELQSGWRKSIGIWPSHKPRPWLRVSWLAGWLAEAGGLTLA